MRKLKMICIEKRCCKVPKNGANISLTSYDDIFTTEESSQTEQIHQIPIAEPHPFRSYLRQPRR